MTTPVDDTRTDMRPELLDILPERMRGKPLDRRGYPVPWFVAWIKGQPDFRIVEPEKLERAIVQHRCWICGEQLGRFLTFVAGPMCLVSRTSAEPPSHLDCALFAAKGCPFLLHPQAKRREATLPTATRALPGEMLPHNPGVTCLYTTRGFSVHPMRGGVLLTMGDCEALQVFAEGRQATMAECNAAIERGLPRLRELAEQEGHGAMTELARRVLAVQALMERATE
jgi:hypothetical protein